MPDPLTTRERELLSVANKWWSSPGALEQYVREHFDLSPTYFWLTVRDLLDDPRALAAMPIEVKHLQSLRDRRMLRAV